MKSAWNIVTTSKWAIILVMAMLSSACSSYFFYPMKEMVRTPADVGLKYRDLTFTTRDHVRIHAWLLTTPHPRGIVYYLHGNAENISTHLGNVYWLPDQGYEVLLLDYRGYGLSQGTPDFPQVFADVSAGYQWLKTYSAQQHLPVFILGQSLGAAISAYYFAELPKDDIIFNGVVLDAVFSGQRDIAKNVLSRHFITWPFQFFIGFFLPKDYDPKDYVADFSPIPLLFFHSRDDQVIPLKEGRSVYERAGEPKMWVTTRGPHTGTFNYADNRQILLDFFAAHGALSPNAPRQTD